VGEVTIVGGGEKRKRRKCDEILHQIHNRHKGEEEHVQRTTKEPTIISQSERVSPKGFPRGAKPEAKM